MNKFKKITGFGVIFMLVGCATGLNLSDPNIRKSITSVKYYKSTDDIIYTELGFVDARYCGGDQNLKGGNLTKEGALTEMRYKASRFNANGLVNVICQSDGLHLATNCNSSVKCYGDAVKIN